MHQDGSTFDKAEYTFETRLHLKEKQIQYNYFQTKFLTEQLNTTF